MKKLENENLLQRVTEKIPGMIYQYKLFPDGRRCFPFANQAMKKFLGISPEEVVNDSSMAEALVAPECEEEFRKSMTKSAEELTLWTHEFRILHPAPSGRWIHAIATPEKLSDGSILWHGLINDITEKKKLEEEVLKIGRLNILNGKINKMLIHSKNHDALFKEACRIVVEEGHFKMAWIGIVDAERENLKVAKYYGHEAHYMKDIGSISLVDESLKGPTARSILEKKIIVNNDSANNPEYRPWKEAALKRGYHSSIALPLLVNEKIVGALNIYSEKVNYFNEREIELLKEISNNVSYAIEVQEQKTELIKSELSFRTIFHEAPLGLGLIDPDTDCFFKVNSKCIEIIGRSREEILNLNCLELFHPDEIEDELENINLLKRGLSSGFKMVKKYIHPNGSPVWLNISMVPLYSDDRGKRRLLCMMEDISERIRYEEDLRSALKAREEFLAIASHELKTPITSLKLQIQMLKKDAEKKEYSETNRKFMKGMENVSRQADRLTYLINNLLDVTRIESGQFAIKPTVLNLSQVLHEITDRFHGLLLEASCSLDLHVQTDVIGVWDQNRIEQVLVNLISNAIKYAPGTPVSIELFTEDRMAIIVVKDRGPGLSEEDRGRIFNQYERLNPSVNVSGVGLGLYISRKIIEAHRGSISVESKQGEGASFTIKLPLN